MTMTKKQIKNLVVLINCHLSFINEFINENCELQLNSERTYLNGIFTTLNMLNISVELDHDRSCVNFLLMHGKLIYTKNE